MQIFITDKTGKRFWNTNVSVGFAQGERKNLARHLSMIKANNPSYARIGIDIDTVKIVEEVDESEITNNISDDDLLNQLFS